MVGDANLDDRLDTEEAEWCAFIKHLPTNVDLQAMMTDMKETFKSQIVVRQHDIKAVMGTVDLVEEAHDELWLYTSQLHNHVLAQSQIIRESRHHVEDLNNRGSRNNIRIRGVPEPEGVGDVPLILESIFNDLLAKPASPRLKWIGCIERCTLREQIHSPEISSVAYMTSL